MPKELSQEKRWSVMVPYRLKGALRKLAADKDQTIGETIEQILARALEAKGAK